MRLDPVTGTVGTGLVRSATDGLVDVEFDGASLRVLRHGGWLDLLDRYRFMVGVAMFGSAYLALLVGAPWGWAVLAVSGMCLLAVVVLIVAPWVLLVVGVGQALTSVASSGGRRRLRASIRTFFRDRREAARTVALPDIWSVEPVPGGLRPQLVVRTRTQGELRLTVWRWRRFQLRRVERALTTSMRENTT